MSKNQTPTTLVIILVTFFAFGCMSEDALTFVGTEPAMDASLDPGLKRVNTPLRLRVSQCNEQPGNEQPGNEQPGSPNCETVDTYEGQCESDGDCLASEACEVGLLQVEACSGPEAHEPVCRQVLRELPRCIPRRTLNCTDEVAQLDSDEFCNHGEEAHLGRECNSVLSSGRPGAGCEQEVIQLRCGSFYSIACTRAL